MAPQPSHSRRIAGGAIRLTLGTAASRVLGFVREMLAAHFFGGRAAMDAWNIAVMIPNLFRGVLAEQAVESAFLPTFKSLTTHGKIREAWRTASVVLNWLLVALITTVVLCYLFAPVLVSGILAPGFDPTHAAEATLLGRLVCPFLLLIGLVAFFGSLLLAHGQFWAYGLAPTLFNVGSIACILLFWDSIGIYALGVGLLIGALLELIGSVVPLAWGRRRGIVQGRCHTAAGIDDPSARQVVKLARPVCLAALIGRCDYMVARAVASFLEVGSIAAIGYAMQLVLLPFSLFGLSIGRAALVVLSEPAARSDAAGFQRGLGATVRLALALLIPISVGTAILAHPLAALLQSGKFGPSETQMVAAALRFYALGLASMGLVSILSRALYALKDTSAPLRASLRALYATVLLSAALALTPLHHAGIALAASISLTFQTVLLGLSLRTRIQTIGPLERGLWFGKPVLKIGIATAIMAALVLVLDPLTQRMIPSLTITARIVKVLIPSFGGAVCYGLVMLALDRQTILRLLRPVRSAAPKRAADVPPASAGPIASAARTDPGA